MKFKDGMQKHTCENLEGHSRPACCSSSAKLQTGRECPCLHLETLGENGNGLVPKVLETHAHVSNVSPRVANCAELPVENCKRAAEIWESRQVVTSESEGGACLHVAEEPAPERPHTMLWMPKSPWTMCTGGAVVRALAASPQGMRMSRSWCICATEMAEAQRTVASNCCDHRDIWRLRKALGDPKSARPDRESTQSRRSKWAQDRPA